MSKRETIEHYMCLLIFQEMQVKVIHLPGVLYFEHSLVFPS
jgi:hypothetical protein